MAMTWKDIKVATLQKMFAAEGNDIPDDGSADDYLAAMPYAANEALQMLATAGRFLIKALAIEHDGTNAKYDLNTLTGDYYDLHYIVYENGSDYRRYVRYQMENGKLVLYNAPAGTYTVYYKAYPADITKDTDDEYVLPLKPEVVVLIPLYMASQLYKDDDNAISTTYRNEFEVAFERLNKLIDDSTEEFTSESGWI
jgi:hypothetical protein